MKRMKHAGLNGLLAAAAITLAGCVPPGANTSATTAALEHCSDFHYQQPPGVELPMKAMTFPGVYDQVGPRVWSGAGAHRVECICSQIMNYSNSSKEYFRDITNKALGTDRDGNSTGLQIDTNDNLVVVENKAAYEFQATSTKSGSNIMWLGKIIGEGSCLFAGYLGTFRNPSDEHLKSEKAWLGSINYVKPSTQNNNFSLSDVPGRLKTLDELRDQHRISDDEYRVQRARILGGI
jgi:hypothetical protein